MAPGPARVRSDRPVGVAVASDQALIAESVVAALRERAFVPVVVRWPPPQSGLITEVPRRRRGGLRRSVRPLPDVGLLLSDLSRVAQVRAARAVVAGLPVPWLVLTSSTRGPAWGGVYDAGAELVLSDKTGLGAVCDLLVDLAAGRRPGGKRERKVLVDEWLTFAAQRSDLTERLETLTDREAEILRALHTGLTVRTIAEEAAVAEGTVRSHVKAILKKLDLNSQVAAVAAWDDVRRDTVGLDDPPVPPWLDADGCA